MNDYHKDKKTVVNVVPRKYVTNSHDDDDFIIIIIIVRRILYMNGDVVDEE